MAISMLAGTPSAAFRLTDNHPNGNEPIVWPEYGHPILHWDLRDFSDCRIPWTISHNTGDLPINTQGGQIQAAFNQWLNVNPKQYGFVPTGFSGPEPISFHRDNYNVVAWNDTVWQDVFGWKVPIPAMTVVFYNAHSGKIYEADTRLNDIYRWVVASTDGEFQHNPPETALHLDVRTIMTHEVGHWLGLDHPLDELSEWDSNVEPTDDYPGPGDLDRNGDGYDDRPVMDPGDERISHWKLHTDDRDGARFLYNPDQGDAPDPWAGVFNQYPTVVHSPNPNETLNERPRYPKARGAEHVFSIKQRQRDRNYSYEWLGWPFGGVDDFDSECSDHQVDVDAYDDGVKFAPNPPVFRKPLHVTDWIRYANDAVGRRHDYGAHQLHTSTWMDFNLDGIWAPAERVIHDHQSPGGSGLGPANEVYFASVETDVTLPDALVDAKKPMWVRSRVDWGEDVGGVTDIDEGLDQTRGAAQFGEVEDYQLRMQKPIREDTPPNGSGNAAAGIAMVYPGALAVGQNQQGYGPGGGCPGDSFGVAPGMSYNPLADETTVSYIAPLGVAPGQLVHIGRAQPGGTPLHALRAYWIPQSGPPTAQSWIPTTNAVVHQAVNGLGQARTRVVVGTVNQQAGGLLTGNPSLGQWNDSMFVSVFVRVSPSVVSLPHLSLCDAQVSSLNPIALGSKWITPESPLVADLPTAVTSGAVILEVNSAWSLNSATNSELLEFDQLTDQTVDVPPFTPVAPGHGLSLRAMPMPTAGQTHVSFRLPRPGLVSLRVYDVRGALQRTLLDRVWMPAGDGRSEWDARGSTGAALASGVYFVRLDAAGERETARVVLIAK